MPNAFFPLSVNQNVLIRPEPTETKKDEEKTHEQLNTESGCPNAWKDQDGDIVP